MINATWHKQHRMPRRPTAAERLEWHVAHAKACGCRKLTTVMLARLRNAAREEGKKRSSSRSAKPAAMRRRLP